MRRHIILSAPDPGADSFELLQSALIGGNLLLELPPGLFSVSRTLRIFSHTTIRATENTVIRRMDHTAVDVHDCLIANADEYDSGNECIELEGGIWDGNNPSNPRGKNALDAENSYSGVALRFNRVRDLTIRDLTVARAESYFIRMCNITDFRILNVKFFSSCFRPNQDGVHLNGNCFHGKIKGLYGISPYTPGDDMIALNAHDGAAENDHFGRGERNVSSVNHGIDLGPIEDIEIEDVFADSVYGFFRILTKDYPVRNIRAKNIRGTCRFLLLNANAFGDAPPGSGLIENVEFSDICVCKVPESSSSPRINGYPLWGLQLKMKNVVIRNYVRPPLDMGCGTDSVTLHPAAGVITAFEPDPGNKPELFTDEENIVHLPDGGFRCLKIDNVSE